MSLVADAPLDAQTCTPIWEPAPRQAVGIPTSSEVINAKPPAHRVAAEFERQLIHALTRPLTCDETHATGNTNRELEVRALFDALSPIDAFVILRRLDADRSDDPLVLAFRSLLAERRARLKAYLADPRRGMQQSRPLKS